MLAWHLAGQEILRRSIWVGLPSSDKNVCWEGQKQDLGEKREGRKRWKETGHKKGGFHKGKLLIVCLWSITLTKRSVTQPCPPRASPFGQLKPHQETLTVIYKKVSCSPWQFTPLHVGFFAGGRLSFKILFVSKQRSHLNTKQPLEDKHFFIFHLRIEEFPSNLAWPEVWEVWKHWRTLLIWANIVCQLPSKS